MVVDALSDFTRYEFTAEGKTRDVYRIGTGPAVVVISEMPGITPNVAEFGRIVARNGFTAALPHVFGDPGRPISAGYTARSASWGCVSREFSTIARWHCVSSNSGEIAKCVRARSWTPNS